MLSIKLIKIPNASLFYVTASFFAISADFSWYCFNILPIIQFGHTGAGMQGHGVYYC